MLYLDRPRAYNHTIKLSIIDPSSDPEGWSWLRFKRDWASRVGLVPRLRQRYLAVPLGLNHPVWIDDPDFNLDYHLRRVACPAPGTMVELCELIGELYAHPLDHAHPLWQVWAIEGLPGGRICILLLIHHAMTDGIGILRMLNSFWRSKPEASLYPVELAYEPAPLPSKWRLLADGLRDLPGILRENLPSALRGMQAGRRARRQWRDEGQPAPPKPGDPAYDAPYAKSLSPRRTFVARSFSLDRLKALSKSHKVTLNDVFLCCAAGALRAHAIATTGAPPQRAQIATVPFALVPLSERTRDGNFSTVDHTVLHPHIADPVERLMECRKSALMMKRHFEATREANVAALFNLLPRSVPKLADRINEKRGGGVLPFWNVVVSNVPGPREHMRLGSLELEQWYSTGQIAHGAALNITGWSYTEQFNICILVDKSVTADAWPLMESIEASLVELERVGIEPH